MAYMPTSFPFLTRALNPLHSLGIFSFDLLAVPFLHHILDCGDDSASFFLFIPLRSLGDHFPSDDTHIYHLREAIGRLVIIEMFYSFLHILLPVHQEDIGKSKKKGMSCSIRPIRIKIHMLRLCSHFLCRISRDRSLDFPFVKIAPLFLRHIESLLLRSPHHIPGLVFEDFAVRGDEKNRVVGHVAIADIRLKVT
jgi:hypothetical protein